MDESQFSEPTRRWLASGRHLEIEGKRVFLYERGAGQPILMPDELLASNQTLPQAMAISENLTANYIDGLKSVMKRPESLSEDEIVVMNDLIAYQAIDGCPRYRSTCASATSTATAGSAPSREPSASNSSGPTATPSPMSRWAAPWRRRCRRPSTRSLRDWVTFCCWRTR